jgi:hypothetical protein
MTPSRNRPDPRIEHGEDDLAAMDPPASETGDDGAGNPGKGPRDEPDHEGASGALEDQAAGAD